MQWYDNKIRAQVAEGVILSPDEFSAPSLNSLIKRLARRISSEGNIRTAAKGDKGEGFGASNPFLTRVRREGFPDSPEAERLPPLVSIDLAPRVEGDAAIRNLSKFSKEHGLYGYDSKPPRKLNPLESLLTGVTDNWNGSYNDDLYNIALQLAARDEFGLHDAKLDHIDRKKLQQAQQVYQMLGPGLRNILRQEVEDTQGVLDNNGVGNMELYRGWYAEPNRHKYLPPDIQVAIKDIMHAKEPMLFKDQPLHFQPISSATTNQAESFKFSEPHDLPGAIGLSARMSVPKNRILTLPTTGPGDLDEEEVTLGGGRYRGDIMVYPSGLGQKARSYSFPPAEGMTSTASTGPATRYAEVGRGPRILIASRDDINYFAKMVGPGTGTNPGGIFDGSDGKRRYIKMYSDPAQAHGENLANSIYRDLGLHAPNSAMVPLPSGKGQAYASDWLENIGNVGKKPSHEDAHSLLHGFGADVLTANWDALGQDGDNAVRMTDGGIARIDNGGAFLSRAQGERKPQRLLSQIPEWEGFTQPDINRSYSGVFQSAGLAGPHSIGNIRDQMGEILRLRNHHNGWEDYVTPRTQGLNSRDQKALIHMLESRTDLLKRKISEL